MSLREEADRAWWRGGRPAGCRSYHELPLERGRSDWAGVMQNESRATDGERGEEGGRQAAALSCGLAVERKDGGWLGAVESAVVEHAAAV
jgi:hypothetical protein